MTSPKDDDTILPPNRPSAPDTDLLLSANDRETDPPPPLPKTFEELSAAHVVWLRDFEHAVFAQLDEMARRIQRSEFIVRSETLMQKLTDTFNDLVLVREQQHATAESQRTTALRIEAALSRMDAMPRAANGA